MFVNIRSSTGTNAVSSCVVIMQGYRTAVVRRSGKEYRYYMQPMIKIKPIGLVVQDTCSFNVQSVNV